MLIYKNNTIYTYYLKRFILAYSSIDLLINYKSCYFKRKTSFLILLNFNYYGSKLMERNLDIDKSIAEKNLLILYSKAFIKRKKSLLAIKYYIYIKKIR